ncbi:hypothetical protein GCM10027347_59240 [Larkinella harenae]
MARPTNHRSLTERFRVNPDEQARLDADAAEAGLDKSTYYRHRLLSDAPLTTGKGMSRPDLRQCLALNTAAQVMVRKAQKGEYTKQTPTQILEALTAQAEILWQALYPANPEPVNDQHHER